MKLRYSNKELYRGVYFKDPGIIAYIQKTYWKQILKVISDLGGPAQDAADLFQDTMEVIIKTINRQEPVNGSGFRVFFRGIARNIYLFNRRSRKFTEMISIDEIPEPASEDRSAEERETFQFNFSIVRAEIQKLRELCRRIIEMLLRELSAQEMADNLNMRVERVYKEKSLCREQLIERIRQNPLYKKIQWIESNPVKRSE